MSDLAPVKRPGLGTALLVLVCLAILIGLGVWQLQRLKWKEGVLAHVAALQSAPAHPLGDVLKAGGDIDFSRVSFDCPDVMSRPRVRVYSLDGGGQIVYRQMTACPLSNNTTSVLVDIGYEDCASQQQGAPFAGPLVGVLRKSDPKSFVTPPSQPAAKLWFWRDLPAMAKALGVDAPLPLYVSLERGPQPASGCRLARTAIPLNIPNRHLEYALTWFGLAASLIGVYAAMLLRKRRA
jgi:surfeit locus 1 family protein